MFHHHLAFSMMIVSDSVTVSVDMTYLIFLYFNAELKRLLFPVSGSGDGHYQKLAVLHR